MLIKCITCFHVYSAFDYCGLIDVKYLLAIHLMRYDDEFWFHVHCKWVVYIWWCKMEKTDDTTMEKNLLKKFCLGAKQNDESFAIDRPWWLVLFWACFKRRKHKNAEGRDRFQQTLWNKQHWDLFPYSLWQIYTPSSVKVPTESQWGLTSIHHAAYCLILYIKHFRHKCRPLRQYMHAVPVLYVHRFKLYWNPASPWFQSTLQIERMFHPLVHKNTSIHLFFIGSTAINSCVIFSMRGLSLHRWWLKCCLRLYLSFPCQCPGHRDEPGAEVSGWIDVRGRVARRHPGP